MYTLLNMTTVSVATGAATRPPTGWEISLDLSSKEKENQSNCSVSVEGHLWTPVTETSVGTGKVKLLIKIWSNYIIKNSQEQTPGLFKEDERERGYGRERRERGYERTGEQCHLKQKKLQQPILSHCVMLAWQTRSSDVTEWCSKS